MAKQVIKEEPKTEFEKFLKKYELKEEVAEIADEIFEKTGYPAPLKAFRLVIENFGSPIESYYFWVLNQLRHDQNFAKVDKIVDSFSASETSSFWGQNSQRLSIQQDKAGGYLRVISELVKQLFQIVRELRMIDEKLAVRNAWDNPNTGEKYKSADVTLKSEFVELVEGGAKDANSVYGLAREVGFHILPDLFFNTQIYSLKSIDKKVDSMEYNGRVKDVLRKKLFNFINWVGQTNKEFKGRREFQLKYMFQHWQTIRTYLKWIKPYLRNIKRLSMNSKHIDSVDIVAAFETSIIEIEFLAHKSTGDGANACILANFYYTTRPEMSFHTQDYQSKGPVHLGKVIINLKSYAWSDDQINSYKKLREDEDLELLGLADDKIQSSMDMLGDTFKKYLEECGEIIEKKKEEPKKKQVRHESIFEPFIDIFRGFGELGGAIIPIYKKEKEEKQKSPNESALAKAKVAATLGVTLTYKFFKKSNGFLAW
jgi:hypothetical protein